MWWSGVVLAVGGLAWWWYRPVTKVIRTPISGTYLKIPYWFDGKRYDYYVKLNRIRAAQGWAISTPRDTPVPFYPGAIPEIPAEVLGEDFLYVKIGTEDRKRTRFLSATNQGVFMPEPVEVDSRLV